MPHRAVVWSRGLPGRFGAVIVNVCPSGVANAPPEAVWRVLTDPQRYGDWMGVDVVNVHPPGAASPGQHIDLAARAFGRRWQMTIDIGQIDPDHRWIDMLVKLPFDIVNRERVSLSSMDGERTLVRFN